MIVVRSSVIELGMFREEYEAFVAALGAEGFAARVDDPEERRGLAQAAHDVGIWLGSDVAPGAAAGLAVEAVVRAARATIGRAKRARRTQPLRRLPIYGPDGKVLSWVELPAAEDDD